MEIVYFAPPIPQILYTGDKKSTFRVTGSEEIKRIVPGTSLSLRLLTDHEFARVICNKTKITTFAELTEEDWKGHERFASVEEMLQIYSNWEKRAITLDTELKIIGFNYRNFFPQVLRQYCQ